MKELLYILILAIGISLLLLLPLAFIWSINTLFGLGIAYNFWTWLAALFLKVYVFPFQKLKIKKGE